MEEFKKQEALKPYFESSYGYAIFPLIAKAGIGIGGAGGKGEVYIIHKIGGKEELTGTATMGQVSLGFQFGAQAYSEIIFFETEREYKHFTADSFEFGAEAGAVALTASAKCV